MLCLQAVHIVSLGREDQSIMRLFLVQYSMPQLSLPTPTMSVFITICYLLYRLRLPFGHSRQVQMSVHSMKTANPYLVSSLVLFVLSGDRCPIRIFSCFNSWLLVYRILTRYHYCDHILNTIYQDGPHILRCSCRYLRLHDSRCCCSCLASGVSRLQFLRTNLLSIIAKRGLQSCRQECLAPFIASEDTFHQIGKLS
jgi:hypothetical protein